MSARPASRRGALLIVVAALCAIIAAFSLAFLMRMRSDAEDTATLLRESQARIMLTAACNYVQEASRMGWDDPSTPLHEECFGWIDVRDGKRGPKVAEGADDDSRFPVGSSARFPMHVLARAPYAIRLDATPNPIASDPASPRYGRPYLALPDPMPAVANGWAGHPGSGVSAANWTEFERGDRRPRPGTTGSAWFRIHRVDGDSFIATCGGGATLGFRSFDEPGADQVFADRATFNDIVRGEYRAWYLIQWSPAVAGSDIHNPHSVMWAADGRKIECDHFISMPMNTSHSRGGPMRTLAHCKNPVGTIRLIQRLRDEPTRW